MLTLRDSYFIFTLSDAQNENILTCKYVSLIQCNSFCIILKETDSNDLISIISLYLGLL